MAYKRWLGKAQDIQQTHTITVGGTWLAGETITVTIAGIEFVVTIGAATPTTAQVATTLKQLWNGESPTDTLATSSPTLEQGGAKAIAQFYPITASVSGAIVTLTVDTAGRPVTITSAIDGSVGGTVTLTPVTVATGKHFGDNPDNWEGGVPVDNDIPVFDSGNVDVKYNMVMAMQPSSFVHTKGFTGRIGLSDINEDNPQMPYPEYLNKYLTFDSNAVTCTYHFYQGEGQGGPLVRVDAGDGQSIFNVYGSAAQPFPSGQSGQPGLLLLGSHASNVLNAIQGNVGYAYSETETSNINTARIGNGLGSQSKVYFGPGVGTIEVLDVSGGSCTVNTATSAVVVTANGSVRLRGTAAHANISVVHGILIDETNGTITTLTLGEKGSLDRSGDLRPQTITNLVTLFDTSIIKDPHSKLTLSAGFQKLGSKLTTNLDFGANRTYTVA